MTWCKIYIRICFSLSVHFSLPRRRSYGFITHSTFVVEEGVRNPLELLRGRLSPLRMDLKIIDAKQEYNKLAIAGQYPPHSWHRYTGFPIFQTSCGKKEIESNYPEVRDTKGLRNWDSTVVTLCDCTLLGFNKETLVKDAKLRNKLTALEMTSKCSK